MAPSSFAIWSASSMSSPLSAKNAALGGRYHLHRLIERYGVDAKLFDWSDEITADCPRKQAQNLNEQCGAGAQTCQKVV
jgi:hypothetical protein